MISTGNKTNTLNHKTLCTSVIENVGDSVETAAFLKVSHKH